MNATAAASRISRPPAVGVPCLATWWLGPSSRICCPYSFRRRKAMNRGPSTIETTIAMRTAMRTRVTSGSSSDVAAIRGRRHRARGRTRPRPGPVAWVVVEGGSWRRVIADQKPVTSLGEPLLADQVRRDCLESHCARRLDEHRVPGAQDCRHQLARLLRRGHPVCGDALGALDVAMRQLADGHQLGDPELGDGAPDLAMELRSVGPELGHVPEHDEPPSRAGPFGEVLERGAHRNRIRVVAVVHQDTASGQLVLVAEPAGESDLELADVAR